MSDWVNKGIKAFLIVELLLFIIGLFIIPPYSSNNSSIIMLILEILIIAAIPSLVLGILIGLTYYFIEKE